MESTVLTFTKQYFSPLVWYGANQWLLNFAYPIEVTARLFIKAALLIGISTLLTVCFQSIKAAWSDPARVLRGNNKIKLAVKSNEYIFNG